MWMVVGLGNPGPEYAESRHNVGSRVVDLLAHDLPASSSSFRARRGARVLRTQCGGETVLLLKPLSFMNASGVSVRAWCEAEHATPETLIVIHDDLDLAPGRLRVRRRGRHGGHRGVLSIQEELGVTTFPRVKVGIGRPPAGLEASEYVLMPPRGDEKVRVAEACVQAAEAVCIIICEGIEAAMNRFNTPPRRA